MKKARYLLLTILIAFIAGSCSDSPTKPPVVEEASAKKQFVWEGLNFWYYWQDDVPELRDNHFESDQAYQNYLMGFADAEALFDELKYSEDRFSWFIEDYEKQEAAFQGKSISFGFSFGLIQVPNYGIELAQNDHNVWGYVQYVLPGSPADNAGLGRGDIFVGVNGTALNDQNYISLLNSDSYELTMAEMQNNTITETGVTVNMQAVTIQENPVFITKVIDTGSKKVGYMALNAFRSNYHQALNDSVGTLLA
ncbi:MAG TPA: PDZ domain-containing protein, partial [Balneolaceae bacterium]|nr:PDZ domain-containing protein [Balneolaceae bacterium]